MVDGRGSHSHRLSATFPAGNVGARRHATLRSQEVVFAALAVCAAVILIVSGLYVRRRPAATEKRFRAAIETTIVGFTIFSAVRDTDDQVTDFRYEFANEAHCRLLGMTKEQLLGR
jgi:PAS domain-containing protein